MNTNDFFGLVGFVGVVVGAVCCVAIVLVCLYALLRRNYIIGGLIHILVGLQANFLLLAVFSLAVLLQVKAFEYPLVFNAVEEGMPALQKLGGLWSGQASSLLFWSCVMSLMIALALRISKRMENEHYSILIALIMNGTLLFFLVPVLFFTSPFNRFWISTSGEIREALWAAAGYSLANPTDGIGMNPSLRHPAMLFHPPTLYFGLIGFFAPYAFALASLILNDERNTWVKHIFPIALLANIFLTIGMFLGSWWAYTILGWGGYWGWDAVEIAGLLPWLLSFGLLHSMAAQIRGAPFQRWVYGFSIVIVVLILFGVLLTRSGIIESVHAYSTGALGPVLSVLIVSHLSISGVLMVKRWKVLGRKNLVSRRSTINTLVHMFNTCMMLLVAILLFGQTLPVTSQLWGHTRQLFSPGQYELYSAPMFLAVLVITGLLPLVDSVRESPGKARAAIITLILTAVVIPLILLLMRKMAVLPSLGLWAALFLLFSWIYGFIRERILIKGLRTRQEINIGLLFIHLGIALLAIGILAVENLDSQQDVVIAIGEEQTLGDITILGHFKQDQFSREGHRVFVFQTLINEGGKKSRTLQPTMVYYPKLQQFNSVPAIHSNLWRDLQVILSDWHRPSDGRAVLRVHLFPLMSWIWLGGVLIVGGGVLHLVTRTHR